MQNLLERRFAVLVFHVEGSVFFRASKRVNALRLFAAVPIENQVAGDGEKPGFKFPFAVVLVAAFEYAEPGFLKKVFGVFAVGGEMQQVTEQAKLILLDELVEQFRIAALQTARQGFCIVTHEGGEAYRGGGLGCGSGYPELIDGAHLKLYTGQGGEKTQGGVEVGGKGDRGTVPPRRTRRLAVFGRLQVVVEECWSAGGCTPGHFRKCPFRAYSPRKLMKIADVRTEKVAAVVPACGSAGWIVGGRLQRVWSKLLA
jgi:hypothetical protein